MNAETNKHAGRWGALVAVALLAIFSLLQNPYWVRSGDGEAYLGIARSIATGRGFWFNGQPVALVPPGWPYVLAAVMKITGSFAVLKMLPMLMMAGGLTCFFFVLCRYALPYRAALVILLTGLLTPVYPLTYSFLAEGMFCLISCAALLVACQINEGKNSWPRIALLAILCGLSLTARWTGILFWPVIAGALLRGHLKPPYARCFIGAVISFFVTVAVFFGLRHMLKVPADRIDPRYDSTLSVAYDIVSGTSQQDTFASRMEDFDQWISSLLWSRDIPAGPWREATRGAAKCVIVLYTIAMIDGLRRREWIWLATAAYYGALAVNWPSPVARYMVPVAPLVILGTINGLTIVSRLFGAAWREDVGLGLRVAFVTLLLLPNLGFFMMEAWAMRGRDFYARFQGGIDQSLTSAVHELDEKNLQDGELAVSRRFATPDSERLTNGWMRSAALLTGRAVMTMPDDLSREPDAQVAKWMADNHAKYYLYLPRVYIFGNFKLLSRGGVPIGPDETSWRLYELVDGQLQRVPLPPQEYPPRKVPGLKADRL